MTNNGHRTIRVIYNEDHGRYEQLKWNPEAGDWHKYGKRKSNKSLLDAMNRGDLNLEDLQSQARQQFDQYRNRKRRATQEEREKDRERILELQEEGLASIRIGVNKPKNGKSYLPLTFAHYLSSN